MSFKILVSGRNQLQAIPEYAFNFKDSHSNFSSNNTAIQQQAKNFQASSVFCVIKSHKDKLFTGNFQANFRENYFYWDALEAFLGKQRVLILKKSGCGLATDATSDAI